MKATYDPQADAAYFYLGAGEVADTREIADNVLIDLDLKGRIIGLEVLHASLKIAPGAWSAAPAPGLPEARVHAAE